MATSRPIRSRETKPLARARAPAELLAWCHFNRVIDKKTNWRIHDIKQSIDAHDVRKAIESIEGCFPQGVVTASDTEALANAPRPLQSLLMVNVGTNPLSEKIKHKGVLTSNRTDAFQFGGQGMNLVRAVDLLMVTSWEEVFVFHFEGNVALIEALMEYMQWAAPLGSVELTGMDVCCLSKDYSQAVQRRVQAFATNVIESMCRADAECEHQHVVQLEQQLIRLYAKNERPGYEIHRSGPALIKSLSAPRTANTQTTIDPGCTDLGPLPFIFANNRFGTIQFYVHDQDSKADIYVLDEYGALFTTQQDCFRVEMIFDHYLQFFQALLKHHVNDSHGADEAMFEMFRLKSGTSGDFLAAPISVTMPRDEDYLSVRVFVDIHSSGAQQFTIFCEDEEFSSTEYGGRLFVAIAEFVYRRRGRAERYPIHITDLELSNRFRQQRKIDEVQTIHVLNYKKRIEHELTRALQVDLRSTA